MTRFALLILCLSLGMIGAIQSQTLTATDGNNDAYIDVSWNLPATCFDAGGGNTYNEGVYLELRSNNIVIYTETIDQVAPALVTNSFRHFVGPSQNNSYSLTLYVIGPGNTIVACSALTDSGSTLAFQAPTMVTASDATFAHKVHLSWQNKSKLSTNFLVVRKSGANERLVATIAGSTVIDSVFTFDDIYKFNDTTTLINGQTYTYAIRTFSALTNAIFNETSFPTITDQGSTYDIGAMASDFTFPDKVNISWNSVAAFADKINIVRNGNVIKTIDNPAATAFTDLSPVYGLNHIYEIELVKNGLAIVRDGDMGGVDPIGRIAGFVRNKNGYGIAGAKVKYTTTIFGVAFADSTTTDHTGYYEFTGVYYGLSAVFNMTAKHTGFSVTPALVNVTLSNDTPASQDINFVSSQVIPAGTDVVTLSNFTATPGPDILTLSWSFTSTGDTTYFQLYRENKLIGIIDNSTGSAMQLVDRTGEPEFYYKYELKAYTLGINTVNTASIKDTFQFPGMTAPTNVAVTNNYDVNSMGVLTVTWDHASDNFDGFRIYRDTVFLAEIPDTSIHRYTDYMGNPGEAYVYSVAAFRVVNEVKYESDPVYAPEMIFPDFVEPTSVTATALPQENAVLVTWTLASAQVDDDNFTGFKILRNGVEIGEILKDAPNEFKDLQGIPGTSYTYLVKLFVEQQDTIFESTGTAAAPLNFPIIEAPATLTSTNGSGKIHLDWTASNYNTTHQNYDGFIVEATGLTPDTLPRYFTTFDFYSKENTSRTLSLKAYRIVGGVIYTSVAATQSGAAVNALNALEAPTNVWASDKYPMHIAVTWEYPVFKLSEFIVSRDGVVIDTLPTAARAFYDYDTEPGRQYEYYITALYNAQVSDPVGATGVRRNTATIRGQVLSEENGRNADSLEVRLVNGATVLARTFTNNAGFYIFEELPLKSAQTALSVAVQTQGRSVNIPIASKAISPAPLVNEARTVNFTDEFTLPLYPPRSQRDSVAQMLALVAQPLKYSRTVVLAWALSEGQSDGFEVFRNLTELSNSVGAGNHFVDDNTGADGIQYDYFARAYHQLPDKKEFSPVRITQAFYPDFKPVENLTATASYNGNDNALILNWSHCTGALSFYTVQRNDEVIGIVNAGTPLTFEDKTGKPSQQYEYTVRAVLQNGSTVLASEPVSVTAVYPKVADPKLTIMALPDSNAVSMAWTYKGTYVDGYRVYRDDQLIATLDADVNEYFDIEGLPEVTHEYKVVALLDRMGMPFQSKGATKTIQFPKLKSVLNPMAQVNNDLGNVDLMFNYYARGIDKFEIGYRVIAGSVDTTITFYLNYSQLQNYKMTFRDELAIPGVMIQYMMTAISVRNNVEYRSDDAMVSVGSYPRPPRPTAFTATDGTFENRVELDWALPFDANIDGFVLFRLTSAGIDGAVVPFATISSFFGANASLVADTFLIGPGRRTFADVFNEIGDNPSANFSYVIASFNDAYGTRYYSDGLSNNGYAGIQRQLYNRFSSIFANTSFGWSVAIDGSNAVIGSPMHTAAGGTGATSFFKKNGESWDQKFTYYSCCDIEEFGYDVDVSGNLVTIGAPGAYGVTDVGREDFLDFDFNTGATNDYDAINGGVDFAQFGRDVAVDGIYAYGNQKTTKTIYTFKRTGSSWTQVDADNVAGNFMEYVSLSASDTYIIAGAASDVTNTKGFVHLFKRNGDVVDFYGTINGEQVGDNFGISNDIDGDYMAVGADGKGPGAVYIYRNNNGNWEQVQLIQEPTLPDNSLTDRFGNAVAIKGDYLIVGAKDHKVGGVNSQGMAFLFKKSGNTFDYVDFLNIPGGLGVFNDDFGFSVDLTTDDILIGAPYHDGHGAVFFYTTDLIQLWHQKLQNVQASDGTFSNKTRVSWTFTGNRNYISGFDVYRDDLKIATVSSSLSFYDDIDGVPGKDYVYTVRVSVGTRESLGKSDNGYRLGAGVLEGDVVTVVGNSPVPGVVITARSIVENEVYIYRDTTDVTGHFYIRGVYFGTDVANYELTASFEDHDFLINPINTNISPENPVQSNLFFFDRTAYIVSGYARLKDVSCGIDSVGVRAISTFDNNTKTTVTGTTNEEGFYSLVLKPSEPGLVEIRIEIDSLHIESSTAGMMGVTSDTIRHKFSPSGQTVFTSFGNFPRNIALDFTDTLTYPVKLFVTTVCGGPAAAANFEIEVSTRDGCYQKNFTTGTNAAVTAKLPPLDDLIITVKDVAPALVANILVADYLRYRPNMLDLKTIHIDNYRSHYPQVVLDSLTLQRLVYHKPPAISLQGGFATYLCDDPANPGIIQQSKAYSLQFAVEEQHGTDICSVNEGYLIINNSAAVNNRDTVFYNPSRGAFDLHTFVAGTPNLVFPFRKGINIKYYSATNDYLGEITIPVIVTGSAQLPGSDVIVDPTDNGIVQYPLYILRDPPGDGSTSSIEEGTTIKRSLTTVSNFKGEAGLSLDLKFAIATIGFWTNTDILLGGGFSDNNTYEVSTTVQRNISTSGTSDFVGVDADVLVGVGVAMQLGIGEILEYDQDSCKMNKRRQFSISPDNIKTDWLYTVGQIKQFVKEKKALKDSIAVGSATLIVNNEILTKAQALDRLSTEIFNWEKILEYHSVKSLPHYMLCTQTASSKVIPNGLEASVKAKVRQLTASFCNEIGVYITQDSFKLNDNILWTSDLVQKYEAAVDATDQFFNVIDNLEDVSPTSVQGILDDFISPDFTGASGEVENTTFSAGIDISKSVTISKTESSNFEQRGYFDLDSKTGVFLAARADAGFGLITEIAVTENKVGLAVKLEYEWGKNKEESTETTTTSTYTLSDNDPGDQFSVTAVKARDPGHSPYFQLFGGRSSCPPEPGTIYRDQFDFALIDLPTLATFDELTQVNLDPDDRATFFLQFINGNPFQEQRDFYVYLDGASNTNGAVIQLNGVYMGSSNQDGGVGITFVNPDQPLILPLTLDRNPAFYQYENIHILLRPSCTDNDLFLLGTRDTVTINAFFAHPCSDITIASPGDDWVIARRNPFDPQSRENLIVELRDYDSSNPLLNEIYLEYRPIGGGSGWQRIPTQELEPNYVVIHDSLANYDAANFGPTDFPRFFFVWDITELYDKYPDGIYEIRAIASCGTNGLIESNIIRGNISRNSGGIFAITQPADGIWQRGDEISIRVNKEIDCAKLNQMTFVVKDLTTNMMVPGTVACFYADNTLIFLPTDISLYDDHILRATVYDLIDETGNKYSQDTFRWDFKVIYRDIYVGADDLTTTMYQGTMTTLGTTLFSNQGVGAVNYQAEYVGLYPWLTTMPAMGTVPATSGAPINFKINANNLPLGDTTATVLIRSLEIGGGVDTIRIHVKVLAKPPYWVLDPSQYSTSMTMYSNFAFTDAPSVISNDTMDIVSAWIGNEIRGVARISKTSGNKYLSSMIIYGNPADNGKYVTFRAWDANEGKEYDAFPTSVDSIFFNANTIVGTIVNPEILLIDKDLHRARYIPLNGDGSWTWFSLNSEEADMDVNMILRSLKDPRNGDVIKTDASSAGYLVGTGWISLNGLADIAVEKGYLIYLNGPKDTLRVTGADATYSIIPLAIGWNLVGYPLQMADSINNVLNITTVANGDFIKTVAQDPTLPGLSANMQAQYFTGQWIVAGGTGMELLRPNFAYQIRVSNQGVLFYPGATIPLTQTEDGSNDGPRTTAVCDPNDPSTWTVVPADFASNMIITGLLEIDGVTSFDPNDKVAAFVNGECRGVSPLYYVSALDKYYVTLFIYGNVAGEQVEIRLYDASQDRVYFNTESFTFQSNGLIGNFIDPYTFHNKQYHASYQLEHVACEEDQSGFAQVTSVTGLEPPYQYLWSNGEMGETAPGLGAGDYFVTISGANDEWFVDTVHIEILSDLLTPPQIVNVQKGVICLNDNVTLQAITALNDASFQWYDANGELLSDEGALTIPQVQASQTVFAGIVYHNCYSEQASYSFEVIVPNAGFEADVQTVAIGDTIHFQPAATQASYSWSFGDGNHSVEATPVHAYNTSGQFSVQLDVTDANGCTNSLTRPGLIHVQQATGTGEPDVPSLELAAHPNPFAGKLHVSAIAPKAGRYNLRMLDNQGRQVWQRTLDLPVGKTTIDLSDAELSIPAGAYFLELSTAPFVETGDRVVIPLVKLPRP